MRLDYFVANASPLSRKEARVAIRSKRVRIGDQVCRKAATHLAPTDQVSLDGELLTLPEERYIMLHKPAGVVSATTDPQHVTALSLLPAQWRSKLHLVGRLDLDTTGLLLLTTDGHWSHRITSPRRACPKTYRVGLAAPLEESAARHLTQGVLLKGDPRPTQPAQLTPVSATVIDLTITEGRYHQVKRMLAAVGNHVVSLHRRRIGDIWLDPSLAPGEFRDLSPDEVSSFAGDAGVTAARSAGP
ncbi:pseudouridine synthase [Marinobacter sp. X15-166B]|uniref:pseudouridine synthase n=1 Tax=Marinobacter sp. X15-166B TaxID=1897620 RepID=UPI00085C3476|nr:pseudouridine synthase [Marinobacter sp. X15-166B]OEY65768.1 16S rRNA pseudouridine(516) synthase [Marinobacter sp. X15-166B]